MPTPTQIEIPSFDFTAFYYPEILDALFEFKRLHLPELTDESPQEPLVQLLRAFALVGHLNNTLIDQVANEATLPTARLVDTVRNMLRLIDYELASATPAQVDIVLELAQLILVATEAVPNPSLLSTVARQGQPARFFEILEALTVQPTNVVTSAFVVEDGVFTDVTTQANTAGVGNEIPAWTTPSVAVPGDAYESDHLMFGHGQVMWDQVTLALTTPGSGITGIWEYYDGDVLKAKPTSITDNGTTLTFSLLDYLGTADIRGLRVRVTYLPTGASEDLISDFNVVNRITTTGLLGQSVPSTDPNDYLVGAAWERFENLEDGSVNLTASDPVEYDLPQKLTDAIVRNWSLGTFQGVTAFWMRFRITNVVAPTSPSIDTIDITPGKQYLKRSATQGQSRTETLGSSNGEASQSFLTSKTDFIFGTDTLTVGGVSYTRVDNFLASRPTDRHYRVVLAESDRAQVIFGDGVNGIIPPVGVNNVVMSYRHGASLDGNVGGNTVVQDKQGLSLVNSLFNPRPATGWAEAQGASEASLERAKIEGPASLRVLSVALGPEDAELLAVRATTIDADSDNPIGVIGVSRAFAIEEGFGPKTVELVVVPAGGALASQASLDGLSEFFNGNRFVSPIRPKRFVANQEVTAVNYSPRAINITADVVATGAVTSAAIVNALTRLLQPEATDEDNAYLWALGGELIPKDRIIHEIFAVDSTIRDVNNLVINGVAEGDVQLLTRELPAAGTIVINVNP